VMNLMSDCLGLKFFFNSVYVNLVRPYLSYVSTLINYLSLFLPGLGFLVLVWIPLFFFVVVN